MFGVLLRASARRAPERMAEIGGTVGLSAVGMFGQHSGWALAPNGHTLDLLVGGFPANRRSSMTESRHGTSST
jgi:hypothetical protein